jgi:RNase P subunit RPR2
MNPLQWHDFERQETLRQERIDRIKDSMEAQRRSFVFGNCSLENPRVTREMVDEEADRLSMEAAPRKGDELNDGPGITAPKDFQGDSVPSSSNRPSAEMQTASHPFVDRLTAQLTILSCKSCKRILHPGALFGNRYRDTETYCHKCLQERQARLTLELAQEPYEGDGREDVEERNG